MRMEYVIVGFVILLVVLLVALTMLGGASNALKSIADLFSSAT